jgi:hypothetical protein
MTDKAARSPGGAVMTGPAPPGPRCNARVLKRDTWRVGKGGKTRMHYDKCQCTRAANLETGLCTQHERAGYVILWDRDK